MARFDPAIVKANEDRELSLTIPIMSEGGEVIGRLSCLDRTNASDAATIAALTTWRNANREAFLTQFEATETRTANWLARVVLPGRGRILFLIIDADDKLVGNVGFANLTEESAELDNVLRGELSRYPRIATAAVQSLLAWAFADLGLRSIYLNVFANNDRAIGMYKTLGFLPGEERRLSVMRSDDEIRYLIDSDAGEPTEYGYLYMIHGRSEGAQVTRG
ncbi:GNAT family N-acetyltransferase [Ensifer adhaerens]|uniref:GNAT family N-acetyltransferase n=1 Tax=Ensifer adhaerens TaxID=106592 RepID=UPI003CFFC9D9